MTRQAASGLRSRLLRRGLAWPGQIHDLETVDSTSLWLKEAARAGAAPWTVVLAGEQTAGRGRHGRQWVSPPGGLYLSVLLELPGLIDAARPGVLGLLGGVAVARALVAYGLAARLKWPNDVRVNRRKISGVLVESVMRSGAPLFVLGIGVNVGRFGDEGAPAVLQGRVTSLEMEGLASLHAVDVASAVLTELAVCYDALARQGAGVIVDQWRWLSESWWGRQVEVRAAGQHLRGIAVDVAEDGALVLDQAGAGRCAVYSGDVEELREAAGDEGHACS